jgi:hypothetical protein
MARIAAQAQRDLQTVHAGQAEVEDGDVGPELVGQRQRGDAAVRGDVAGQGFFSVTSS